jgi:effector-binding domain-containing protein
MELPAGPAIATVHVGPYQDLLRAHQALAAWAGARGREASGPAWEVFLTNPLQEPDPQKWRTKVFLPLKPEK